MSVLENIAKAIELAKGNAPYYVMPQFKNKYMVYKTLKPGFVDQAMSPKMLTLDEAEDECEKLNNLYIAEQALKALVPATDELQNRYFKMARDEGHTDISACFDNGRWERTIDAILLGA